MSPKTFRIIRQGFRWLFGIFLISVLLLVVYQRTTVFNDSKILSAPYAFSKTPYIERNELEIKKHTCDQCGGVFELGSKGHNSEKVEGIVKGVHDREVKDRVALVQRSNGSNQEVKHVVFLKVPKSGSSTVQNLFYRFGTSRGLTFVLPTYNNYISRDKSINSRAIIPPPEGKRFEIMCNHARYSRKEFAKLLPNDTMYVGIVREPLTHLESFIYFYHFHNIYGEDKLTTYLNNHTDYMLNFNIRPNPQTSYYGLEDKHQENEEDIDRFIQTIQKEFDMIIILERLEESLLLMKRKFHWSLKDILYFPKNRNSYKPRTTLTDSQRTKHRSLAPSEYEFYNHFEALLITNIVLGGEDFQRELSFYKRVLLGVQNFCLANRFRPKEVYNIGQTEWGHESNVFGSDCAFMMKQELDMQDFVGRRQYGTEGWQKYHNFVLKEMKYNWTRKDGTLVEKRSFSFKDRKGFMKPQ